jgi:hypothetical protein
MQHDDLLVDKREFSDMTGHGLLNDVVMQPAGAYTYT